MVRDNRKVDSAVLRSLASATRAQRDQLDDIYRACRSRVESAPRGWSTGEWDGTLSFMRQELRQMDLEHDELIARAWKTDIASAIAALTETLPLGVWKFLLASNPPIGLAFANPGGALDLVATVEKFVKGFTNSQGRGPTVTELGTLVSGGALAGLGLTLTRGSTGNGLADVEIGVGSGETASGGGASTTSGAGSNPRFARVSSLVNSSYSKGVVEDLYAKVKVDPYPKLIAGLTDNDCVTFAGAALITLGLGEGQIPGRSSGGVDGAPDAWKHGWHATTLPTPGSYIRATAWVTDENGTRSLIGHSALYMGALGDKFVIAESNWAGSGPQLALIKADGSPAGRWEPSMGTPNSESSSAAAAAITKRFQRPGAFLGGAVFHEVHLATNELLP